jgi:hypothetical protein
VIAAVPGRSSPNVATAGLGWGTRGPEFESRRPIGRKTREHETLSLSMGGDMFVAASTLGRTLTQLYLRCLETVDVQP